MKAPWPWIWFAAFAVTSVMMHAALNQRDDARQVSRDQAIEQLCQGAVSSSETKPLADPASEPAHQHQTQRFQL